MYVFDKEGTWEDEGVYHEGLGMDNTYNETNWYDEFNVQSFWNDAMEFVQTNLLNI